MKIDNALGGILKKVVSEDVYLLLKKKYLFARFIKQYFLFKRLSKNASYRFVVRWRDKYPQLLDDSIKSGFDTHYIYHPAWAARILSRTNPSKHVDVSSTISFSSIVSAFVPIEFYDYRPANLHLSDLHTGKADLLNLPFMDNSIQSLSCMHVVEHIGLGRYGEPINPDADLIAIQEIIRVLAPGGRLLFVAPIGKPRILFNAHRVYSYAQVVSYFGKLSLEEFSLIPDNADEVGMLLDSNEERADQQNYGCGCFCFIKLNK